jgi:hypothetical protein
MWFLEHESLFGGKRVWLRPGSQQLFGRTKPSDGDSSEGKKVFIDNKNVSRKHMMIKVLEVPPENGTKLHTRSQIEVIDLSCRQGTTVDARSLKSTKGADGNITYDKTVLTDNEHTVKLSNSYPPFKIKWQDFVFTSAAKDKKENATRYNQLHAMDIKTSSEFVYGKTTHVVSQKRNLPKVLQALVSGKPIVTTYFLDAVLKAAAHSVGADDSYLPSQLEEDFDTWWPQEKEYIPPAGNEPVGRPEHMLAPDPSRSEVFSGLTFIFLDENQHASLHQVVAGGGGKALFFDIQLGETTVEEYLEYVQKVAGQKKRSQSSGALPVVTIRLSASENLADWATDFVNRVDLSLNQRSILQNEFLDAIVTKDNSQLRRPPTEIVVDESSTAASTRSERLKRGTTPSASQSKPSSQAPESASAQSEDPVKTTTRKRPLKRGATSRFTGFDDYEPPTKTRKVEEDTPMEDIQESPPVQESPPQPTPVTQTQTQSRRTARSQPVEETLPKTDPAEQMDQLFPTAAAIKRQRAATRAPSASVEPEIAPTTQKQRSKAAELTKKMQKTEQKANKEINVREETRKRIEEDEEKRRLEEESLRQALDGVNISEIRANIQIEEMKMRPRKEKPDVKNQAKGERWDPAWDGRKNFKKFRRRGVDRGPQSQRVLVTFEEAPGKKGFGEPFFLVADTETPVRNKEAESGPSRRQGTAVDIDSEPETGFTRKKRAKASEVVIVEDSGPDDEEEEPVPSRGSGRTQRVAETQLEEEQTQSRGKKRGPVSVAAGQPSLKKGRLARKEDSDSDAEETGFRFKRRG